MADFRSKVTLRPRSRLERLLDLLDPQDTRTPPSAEYLAVTARSHSAVAPTLDAARVALRLGYPGNEVAALARALDAEVPEGDVVGVAYRAHHHLHLHGTTVCVREQPACGSCRLRAACAYRGEGVDPALRLEARTPPADG